MQQFTITDVTKQKFPCKSYEHLSYSLNLSSDKHLFGPLKEALGSWAIFSSDKEKEDKGFLYSMVHTSPSSFLLYSNFKKHPISRKKCVDVKEKLHWYTFGK